MKVAIEVSDKRIADLLCSAFEGGSNYWYRIEEFIEPPAGNLWKEDPDDTDVFRRIQYPLSVGGALVVSDYKVAREARTERLDRESIARGLVVMAEKYGQHFGAWLSENDDAITGDVFLQCCLFGDVVYG